MENNVPPKCYPFTSLLSWNLSNIMCNEDLLLAEMFCYFL